MANFDSISTTNVSLFGSSHGLGSPGNHAAWEAFYQKYAPCMRDICQRVYRLNPDETEEVTQRLMVKLLERMANFRYSPDHSFRKYLKKATKHAVMDLYRERQPASNDPEDVLHKVTESQLAEVLNDEWVGEYRKTLFAQVSPEIKSAVTVEHWRVWAQLESGRRPADVAEEFDLSVANVYQIKKRIKERFRQAIRDTMLQDGILT